MYKCKDCGYIFDEPNIITERHGFSDGLYEHFEVCPQCGGDFNKVEEVED